MENEYNIPIKSDIRKDVSVMCNLGEGIAERATENANVNMILTIMDLHGFSYDAVADFLGVKGKDRENYRKAIADRKKKSHS